MSIKNRLYIGVLISFTLAVLFISVVLIASGEIAKKNKKHDVAHKIESAISELNIVMYEYLLHHEKRMRQQWISKYNSIMEILVREEEVKKLIHADYATLKNLFSQVTVNYVKSQKLIQEGAFQEKIDIHIMLEERLVTQLLMKSHSIISDASMFGEKASAEAAEVHEAANILGLIIVIFFAFTVTTVLLVITRSISKPLHELTKGTEIIGKGDLDHKVEIKTKDELGELAAAFNLMTERRKRAEEALRQSEAKYIDLYSSAPVAYFSADTDGFIQVANKAAEHFTGYPSDELHRMKVFNLYAEESKPKAKDLFERFKKGIPFENEEMVYKRQDGRKLHGALSVHPVKDGNGFVFESRSVVVDITKRKQTEKKLEKHREHLENTVKERTSDLNKRVAEMEHLNKAMANLLEDLRVSNENLELATQQLTAANKELESFSYSVSHDLRAPLRAITGFSQILVEDYRDKLDADGFRQLNVIQSSARQMGQLIDDLLTFSRLGRKGISLAEIDMAALAQDVSEQLRLAASEPEPQMNIEALPSTIGDQNMVRQVFVNLLSNSMKYAKPDKPAFIEVRGKIDGNENIYSVKDNGVGFDMKYVDKLFRVFQRLHSAEEFEGTGIGLALIQRIIHRHGGRVWAEGQVNQGATFYFTLPVRKDKHDGK